MFREVVRMWEGGDIDQIERLIAPGYVGHVASGDRDTAGLKERIIAFRSLYPDVRITIEDQIAEGDRVASRMRAFATDQATGAPATLLGLNISRIIDGRVIEEWAVWERLAEGG